MTQTTTHSKGSNKATSGQCCSVGLYQRVNAAGRARRSDESLSATRTVDSQGLARRLRSRRATFEPCATRLLRQNHSEKLQSSRLSVWTALSSRPAGMTRIPRSRGRGADVTSASATTRENALTDALLSSRSPNSTALRRIAPSANPLVNHQPKSPNCRPTCLLRFLQHRRRTRRTAANRKSNRPSPSLPRRPTTRMSTDLRPTSPHLAISSCDLVASPRPPISSKVSRPELAHPTSALDLSRPAMSPEID